MFCTACRWHLEKPIPDSCACSCLPSAQHCQHAGDDALRRALWALQTAAVLGLDHRKQPRAHLHPATLGSTTSSGRSGTGSLQLASSPSPSRNIRIHGRKWRFWDWITANNPEVISILLHWDPNRQLGSVTGNGDSWTGSLQIAPSSSSSCHTRTPHRQRSIRGWINAAALSSSHLATLGSTTSSSNLGLEYCKQPGAHVNPATLGSAHSSAAS